jgi:glycyl-tRNA synthetase beta chain
LEQHYWPLSADGVLPENDLAALVALSDKLDTLAANFSINLVPTGSADPYGLRRMAVGVVRILLDRKWNIPLPQLIELAGKELTHGALAPEAAADLLEFFKQRCTTWFSNQGYRLDELDAVLTQSEQSLFVQQEKLESLKTVRGRPEFDALASAIKRARNLLTQAKEKGVLPKENELRTEELVESSEKSLYQALVEVRANFIPAVEERKFQDALLQLVALKNPIDTFFKEVMVMVEDETVRSRRLRLLILVKELFDMLVDFSRLQGTSAPPPVATASVNE